MLDILTKTCTRCLNTKTLDEFNKERLGKFGVRSKCKPCLKETNAESVKGKVYSLDQEKARARRAKWEEKNPEWRKNYSSEYRLKNKDAINQRRRESYRTKPEYKAYVVGYVQKRRALRNNASGSYTKEQWLILVDRYKKCVFPECNETKLTVDHIVPLSLGGSNSIDNIQPLCRAHNAKKHLAIVDYRTDICEIKL